MVTPGRKDQQRFGQRVHGLIEDERAQLFGQWCAARLAGQGHDAPLRPKGIGQTPHMGGLAGTVDALEADEKTVVRVHESLSVHECICRLRGCARPVSH